MIEGMLPVKLFLEKSMTLREKRCPMESGMVPVIRLPERERKYKLGKDSPMFDGMTLLFDYLKEKDKTSLAWIFLYLA